MIKIEDISKEWEDFGLEDISLEIQEEEYFIILGPTGSGKTLLLELLAGFYKPDKGSIKVDGDIYTHKKPNERRFGFVYQDYMLFPHMDVRENIAYGLKVRDSEDIDGKVEEMAEMVGVSHLLDRRPNTLSGGEQQRVALARALVFEPEILLLDEPFGSLDYQTSKELRELVKDLHSKFGGTTIHVTHDQEEAVVMGDRMGVMKEGKVIQLGRAEEIMRKPESRFVAEFVGTGNIFHGTAKDGEGATTVDIGEITIHSTSRMEGDVTASLRPEDIIISEEKFDSSARNNFEGTIQKITDKGIYQEVNIDIGIPLIVYVTRQSVEDLSLEKGKGVNVLFKASAVHLFSE